MVYSSLRSVGGSVPEVEALPAPATANKAETEQDVADDAAARSGDHPERDHPHDVDLRHLHRRERPVEREGERASQV